MKPITERDYRGEYNGYSKRARASLKNAADIIDTVMRHRLSPDDLAAQIIMATAELEVALNQVGGMSHIHRMMGESATPIVRDDA